MDETGMPKIEAVSISKRYGEVVALQDVDMRINESEIVCLLGPSGCGKTTLMNIIAGFESVTAGTLNVGGRPVLRPGSDRAVVFQTDALFPWLTTVQNILVGTPRSRRAEYKEKAMGLLDTLRLTGFEKSYPYQLSGGMKQRVSIARALVRDPQVLLMDEPFGALDAQTRIQMQELLQEVWLRYRPTIVFVTHDVDEACLLGDRVFVMSARPGRIQEEFDVPFERPRRYDVTTETEFNVLKRRALVALHGEGSPYDAR